MCWWRRRKWPPRWFRLLYGFSLALVVGLPVILGAIRSLCSHGLTARSLDGISLSICLLLGDPAYRGSHRLLAADG